MPEPEKQTRRKTNPRKTESEPSAPESTSIAAGFAVRPWQMGRLDCVGFLFLNSSVKDELFCNLTLGI